MTADAFCAWLSAMGITAAEAARRLGLHANTVTKYKRLGAPYSIALACRALFHRLPKGAWE